MFFLRLEFTVARTILSITGGQPGKLSQVQEGLVVL